MFYNGRPILGLKGGPVETQHERFKKDHILGLIHDVENMRSLGISKLELITTKIYLINV